MPHLFDPLTVRSITLRNRIGVSPMCQYSSTDGLMTDWHLVHLGSRAIGGAGLVITEAAAVEARGRISPYDAGIWQDAQVPMLRKIASFIAEQGAVPGVQLAHAGRKASTARPWEGGGPVANDAGGWETIAPSALSFAEGTDRVPQEMTTDDIHSVQEAFVAATHRAVDAGFQWVELHAAHGYLMHQFLSPLSNTRTDVYGGSFENRIRFTLETAAQVRAVWPEHLPLTVRVSATDWADGGWTLEETVALAGRLRVVGVDLIDCSSGGAVPHAKIITGPGYQVPFAEAIKNGADILTAAVGMITEAHQADEIVSARRADIVLLAREFLRAPYWPAHAARALGQDMFTMAPPQYARAF